MFAVVWVCLASRCAYPLGRSCTFYSRIGSKIATKSDPNTFVSSLRLEETADHCTFLIFDGAVCAIVMVAAPSRRFHRQGRVPQDLSTSLLPSSTVINSIEQKLNATVRDHHSTVSTVEMNFSGSPEGTPSERPPARENSGAHPRVNVAIDL